MNLGLQYSNCLSAVGQALFILIGLLCISACRLSVISFISVRNVYIIRHFLYKVQIHIFCSTLSSMISKAVANWWLLLEFFKVFYLWQTWHHKNLIHFVSGSVIEMICSCNLNCSPTNQKEMLGGERSSYIQPSSTHIEVYTHVDCHCRC